MFNRDLLPNPQAYYGQYFAFKGNKAKHYTLVYLLETVKAYDYLTRKKDKGRDVPPSQPFKH